MHAGCRLQVAAGDSCGTASRGGDCRAERGAGVENAGERFRITGSKCVCVCVHCAIEIRYESATGAQWMI